MSTAIETIDYDEKTKELTVSFIKGGEHVYHEVPKRVVDNFKQAGSKGRYFNYAIRNNYD